MTGQQLRNSILQEAIQGRLVPNVLEPGEKTGAELLQQILKERQDRENKERGKKAKKLTLSTIEEAPWELPEGWCWCHIHDIAHTELGKMKDSEKNKGELKPYLCTINVRESGIDLSTVKQMKFTKDDCEHYLLQKDDLLICEGGDCGRCSIWEYEIEMYYQNSLHCVRFEKGLSSRFFKYILDLYKYQGLCKGQGVGIKHFTQTLLRGLYFPLPPLSIQKAIVEKIEDLLPLVDEYDKAAGELETLNKILPDKLRKSVLQEAVHGNLVPNDIPEGEATGAELLQQILKERQDKESKEKGNKAKKLTLSTIEEEPWELPEGWCWTQIGDIFDHSAGKSLNSSKQSIGKVYPYLTTSNVYWDGINFETVKEMAFTEEEYKKCSAIKNDILVCEGGDVGRSCIWTYDYTIGLQNHVHRLRAIKNVDVKFFYYVLRFYKAYGIITAKGIGIGGFSANALKGLTVPLPPLSIQHRIVEKIEEVFSAIDKLKS